MSNPAEPGYFDLTCAPICVSAAGWEALGADLAVFAHENSALDDRLVAAHREKRTASAAGEFAGATEAEKHELDDFEGTAVTYAALCQRYLRGVVRARNASLEIRCTSVDLSTGMCDRLANFCQALGTLSEELKEANTRRLTKG